MNKSERKYSRENRKHEEFIIEEKKKLNIKLALLGTKNLFCKHHQQPAIAQLTAANRDHSRHSKTHKHTS